MSPSITAHWSRRRTLLGGLAAATGFARAGKAAMSDYETDLYAKAKKEGEVTWYTAQILGETAQRVVTSFNAMYPGIKVNLLRASGQVLYQRVMQEISMDALQGDVIGLADGGGQQAELKEAGHFAQYKPRRASEVMPAFQNIDPDGYYHVTNANLAIIVYNKQLVKADEKPRTWRDLADPKWKGKAAMGHPGFSSMSTTWVVVMKRLYGWSYFEQLAKNDTQVTRNINDTTTLVTAGERALGCTPVPTARMGVKRGNPIGVIYPEDGSLLLVSPTGIAKNSKHPAAARLLMEFLLGPECAAVIVEDLGDSIRPEVEPPKGEPKLSDIKTIQATFEESKSMGSLVEPFRDLFGF
jgi:iron(III) transport system substrate-binding protein